MSKQSAAPTRKIIAVSHDIGGAQALYPVIGKLKSRRDTRVNVVAGRFAQKLFARLHAEIARTDWSEQHIDQYLETARPDLLVSSTSWKSSLEQGFRNRAHLLGIPSLVVIDFWSNYRLRWQHSAYRFEDSEDHVCVMDELTADAMRKAGYPTGKLYVTGQPHLERCFQRKVRQKTGIGTSQRTDVLFLTISLTALGLKDEPTAPIRVVCQALEQWYAATNKPILLTIRQHPHENPDPDFLNRIRAFAPKGISVRLADRTKPIAGQIERSDMILGYITMALFEARCLGKQVIAIKVADYPPELVSAMAEAGINLLPFDPDQIASFLRRKTTPQFNAPQVAYHGATAAVVKLCCDLAKKK
jgi:hypothetical protein